MKNLQTNKQEALTAYKKAKEEVLRERTNENWVKFCDAKRNCMLLGIIL